MADTHKDELISLLELATGRLAHFETLLLSLAGVAFAGWAFLHAYSGDTLPGEIQDQKGRLVFSIVFAVVIATVYNALFMGRMGVGSTARRIEIDLGSMHQPLNEFFVLAGPVRTRFMYYGTAVFIPSMSASSLFLIRGSIDKLNELLFWCLWWSALVLVGVSSTFCVVFVENSLRSVPNSALAIRKDNNANGEV